MKINQQTKLKKFLLLACSLVLMLTLAAGCGGNDNSDDGNEPQLTASQMLDKVLVGTEDKFGSMGDLTPEQMTDFFGFDANLMYEAAVKISLINVQASEVGVFTVENAADVEKIKAGIDKRMQQAIAGWMPGYMPEEITKMENYTMETKGKYVLYVVADEETKKAIIDNFQSEFK